MTDTEWDRIETELLALWGSGPREVIDRRLIFWRKRWGGLSCAIVGAAIRQLEKTCDHWPSAARMHAAVNAALPPRRIDSPWHGRIDLPLTVAEWRERAELLIANAPDPDRKPGHRYLLTLAAFYEENACRVAAGQEPLWPPPYASVGFMPESRRAFEDRTAADAARARQVRAAGYAQTD